MSQIPPEDFSKHKPLHKQNTPCGKGLKNNRF